MLHSVAEVKEMIAGGKLLLLAGSEPALAQLPKGNWIAGTIPYFMDSTGARCSETDIFVTPLPADAASFEIVTYTVHDLERICSDAPKNGFSVLIMPAGSAVHTAYAQNAPGYDEMFLKPVVGWISGVHLCRLQTDQPKVFNGLGATGSADTAVVMHVALPENRQAHLDIVNVFEQGSGDAITFPSAGFCATDCFVDGAPANLAQYIERVHPDPCVPLTANYNGSPVNVSIQSVDRATGTVKFYAPVFPGVEYRFAVPVPDYIAAFDSALRGNDDTAPIFACNCILNYLYANLEGKRTGSITGPITFGEVAYQLLNQTLVRLLIHNI